MAYASPMKIANGLVLDFTVDNADTAADTFLGLNASGEVTKFASIPRARVSGGGNITEATSSVLTITGGTAAVLTSGLTIQVKLAGAAQSGYLSTTDWNTFNNKLGASLTSAYIYVGNGSNVATGVAISGDITISNAGVVAIASGVIVNADINASAAIAVSKLEALTASRVLGSDGSGVIQALNTATYPSLTELAYVKGVTSAIQTQLNNRLSVTLSSPTNGDVITYNGSAWVNSPSGTGVPTGGTTAQILRKIDNTNYNTEWHTLVAADITDVSSTAAELNKLSGVTTTATQFNFLNTLSGDVQAQLAAKLSTSLTQNYMIVGDASNIAVPLAPGTNGYVLTSVSGVPTWVSPGVGGTVTSVAASGGTTGMSFTGSPITTSGTLTLTGTLAIANGGTGLTALGTAGQLIKVNAGATALEFFTPTYLTSVGTGVTNELTYWSGTNALGSLATATYPSLTELSYVKGLTSSAQTQLGTKWNLSGTSTLTGNTAIQGSGSGFDLEIGSTSEVGNFNVSAAGGINLYRSNSQLSLTTSTGALRNATRVFYVTPGSIEIDYENTKGLKFETAGTTLNIGSDATGDTYYRNSSGYLTRLAAGTNGHVLTLAAGIPSWAAPSGGSGLTVGTTTITSGTNGNFLSNNSGVLGEITPGAGVATWFQTPSWANFNSAITGTAPFLPLSLTGTTNVTGSQELNFGTVGSRLYALGVRTSAYAQLTYDDLTDQNSLLVNNLGFTLLGNTAGSVFDLTTKGNIDLTSTDGTDSSFGSITPTQINLQSTDGANTAAIQLLPNVFKFIGDTAPSVGHVWTASNVDGTGYWAAPSGGGWALTGTSTLTGAVDIVGSSSNTIKHTFNSLGTTQTNGAGLWLANTTAAADGAQQISPSLVLEGQGWKTNATAESQSVIFKQYVTPVQGTSNPSGTLNTYSSINGGADTQVGWSYSSDGSVRDNGTISLGVAGSRNALVNLHSTGYSTGDGILGTITTSGDEIRYSRLGTNILRFTSNGLVIAGTRIGISNTAYLATSNGRVGLYQTEDSGNLQAVISLFNNSVGGNSSANRYVGWYNGTAQPTSANADYALTYAKDANGAGTASLAIMSEDDYETIIGSLNKFPQPVIIGGTSLTTSALLDLQSTTRAFIPPRMTTAQKTSISSPSAGMIVYDTDLSSVQVYSSSWSPISAQTTVSNNDDLGSGNVQWISGSDTGKKYETYFSSNVSSSWNGANTSTNILNTVPDNSVIVVTINFTGVQTSGTAGSSGFHYKVTRAFRRTTTTTTAIGAAEIISSSNDTGDTFGTVPTISTSGSNINFDRALTTTKTFNVSLRVEVEVTD